jgi:hypothetical protein
MMSPSEGKPQFLAGLFLMCMCGLMLQIIETRILSVIAFYYLAFFAIGMAMFGMTAGSLLVYFREPLFRADRMLQNLVWISSAFAMTVVISGLLTITTVLTGVESKVDFLMTALEWGKLVVILATPYFFAGMAISLALTRSPWPIPLVYGVDLVGAAMGCLVVLVVLTYIDTVSAMFLVGTLGAAAGVFFAWAQRATKHAEVPLLALARSRILQRPALLAAGFALLTVVNAAIQPWGLKLSMAKDAVESATPGSLMIWNSFSRINVGPSKISKPDMWGPSPTTPSFQQDQRFMEIDANAASSMYRFDGDQSKLEFLKYDITNLVYSIRHNGRAAVIGVGGGRDLLSALQFGFHDVTGVELNPVFIDLLSRRLRDYNRLASVPGVRLFVDEGRSWFARSTEHFDVLQMSMVDTWAATGAGAFSLSENGLYTVEGWRIFFRHLSPTGVFTVSRWYSPSNIDETGRMMSVAVAALLEEGITDPKDHLYLAATGRLATLIVSRAPFTTEELATLDASVEKLGFTAVVTPHGPAASPALNEILGARTPEALNRLETEYQLDLSPAYDDRPFFFQQLRIGDPQALWSALKSDEEGVIHGNLKAAATLALIIVLSFGLVVGTILVPSLSSIRRVEPRLAFFGSAYFLLIGLGFMFVEIGLIQRISVYLGHPVYGLAIGLFSIIASTGIGSLLSAGAVLLRGKRLFVWATLLGLYVAALPYWFPLLVDAFASADLVTRAVISLSAIVPSGVLMGFGFPTGMQIVTDIDPRPTPWFWAVNGAAGVLASGIAVTISIEFSISTTLWCGAVSYLLLGPVAFFLMKLGAARQPAVMLA